MSDRGLQDEIARLTPEERAVWECRLLEKLPQGCGETTIPDLKEGQSSYPLSFAQERLWFLEQLHPGGPLYNVPWAVRLVGPLDVDVLQESLDTLIERHAVLRTTYHEKDGIPYQVVSESCSVPFRHIDLRGSGNSKERLQHLLNEEAQRPFDLTTDCMLRAIVVRIGTSEHALLLVAHHIAVDGSSCRVLNRELGLLYETLRAGTEVDLPSLPMEYADYASWERDETRNSNMERELAYWRTKLEGLPPTLDLPTQSSPPIEDPSVGATVPVSIPGTIVARLRQRASELHVMPFMILVAGVMVTLYRYTGETDIAIGIPIEGRTRFDTERLVGMFVNTLVLRCDLSGQPSFAEVVQRVREVCLDAYDHQDVPFGRIVAALSPKRIKDRSPIIQVMLAYDDSSSDSLQFPGLDATPITVETDTSKFDLSFKLSETTEGTVGHLVYSQRMFSEVRMRALASHFVRLLETGVDESEQAIGRMPMLSARERERMIADWNSSTAPIPEAGTVHGLFERAAAATPEATAVVCGDDSLTYGDLNERASHLAYYLRGLGVQADELVGISMHRSTDLIVGLLGILKAGAAYLPLDPRLPRERVRFMMEDAAVSILLTQSDLEANFATDGLRMVRLDSDWPTIAQLEPMPSTKTRPENLAYVMYTSGSTGKPKGVMITHRNIAGYLNAFRHVAYTGPQRISTNVFTYTFDVSVEEMFTPLCYGGTLHVVPYEVTLDGRSLAQYVLDHGITTVNTVPDLLPSIAQTFEKYGGRNELACLITGLVPKKQRILQRFRDMSPSLRILNVYGPTETTCASTAYRFEFATNLEQDVPIGRPLANYQVYIVNDVLEPVPIGVTGEILIGGVGVSRGYLNRPDLTAERFIPNPFSTDAVDRVYRTGDLGRYMDDGTIEFLGRTDSQVKIRGHRIELREIELALESHSGITTCHVETNYLEEHDVRLVAYVVWIRDQVGKKNVLRRYLQERLPRYMIPSVFVFLDSLPLLPTGKIDRRALPQPEWSRLSSANRYVSPMSEIERAIAAAWEEVLKIDRVGITDSFFELGGHSLLALRLINRIEVAINVRIPIQILFSHPTIKALSEFVLKRMIAEEETSENDEMRAGDDPTLSQEMDDD